MCTTERYSFEWPWVTLTDSKVFNDMERCAASLRQLSLLSRNLANFTTKQTQTTTNSRPTSPAVARQGDYFVTSKKCSFKRRHFLRSATYGDLLVPRTSTSTYEPCSFAVSGPSVWNKLPATLRVSPTLGQFQSKLKAVLFRSAYETCLGAFVIA